MESGWVGIVGARCAQSGMTKLREGGTLKPNRRGGRGGRADCVGAEAESGGLGEPGKSQIPLSSSIDGVLSFPPLLFFGKGSLC